RIAMDLEERRHRRLQVGQDLPAHRDQVAASGEPEEVLAWRPRRARARPARGRRDAGRHGHSAATADRTTPSRGCDARAAGRSCVLAAAVRAGLAAAPVADAGRFDGVAAARVADGCLDFDASDFGSGVAACGFEREAPVPPDAPVDALAVIAVAERVWAVVRAALAAARPARACGAGTFDGALVATFAGAFAGALAALPRAAA